MKYVVIGAGGTGGGIGGFLSRAGKDVTLIARGAHLQNMQKHGLRFEILDEHFTVPVKACTMEDYQEQPDVLFVCVKGYSLEDTIPFIKRISHPRTVVIPVLNIYGTGRKLQQQLPGIFVTDGCIYISAQIKEPGVILMYGKIFRVVYGLRRDTAPAVKEAVMPILQNVQKDLAEAEILPLLSSQIEKDALQKFSFVSPMAAIGACFDIPAGEIQKEGAMRRTFTALIEEIRALSVAMDANLPENISEINLKIMDDLDPTATASMHRDILNGKQSEIDGLVYEVVRLGKQYGVPVPVYEELAEMCKNGSAAAFHKTATKSI